MLKTFSPGESILIKNHQLIVEIMTQRSLIFLAATISCFLIDLASFFFLQLPQLFLTRCFFYSLAFASRSYQILIITGFFVLLLTLVSIGLFGLDLLVMVPLVGLIKITRHIVEIPWFLMGLLAFGSVLVHGYLIGSGLSMPIFHCLTCLGMVYLIMR